MARHWAMFVGGYYHELMTDDDDTIWYLNRAVVNAGANFTFARVGYTTLTIKISMP